MKFMVSSYPTYKTLTLDVKVQVHDCIVGVRVAEMAVGLHPILKNLDRCPDGYFLKTKH